MTRCMLAVLLLVSGLATAQPSASTTQEIAQLFAALETSGCRFQRNGSWHEAPQAKAHLQRKYDYLLKKRRLTTTESLIDLAASRSSVSGSAYRVQCWQSAPVDSAAWFTGRLSAIRAGR